MRRTTYGVIAVIALAVLVHVALGGLLVTAAGPWKHWVIGLIVAGVAIHIALRVRKNRHKTRDRLVSPADSPRSGGTHEH
ncbi:hypothetical protein [Actinoplanes solisilvae]|uniref:hypothetical protein n=1 Tax=Actinoplanes solisilvae TaxID=2486853 RepID=UPI000FDAB511|nr:hypothetical protein [Actinoplanes solisilvae]